MRTKSSDEYIKTHSEKVMVEEIAVENFEEESGRETTLCLPTQPTNQPTANYISIRLKLDHKYLREVIQVLDVPDYCIYEHKRDTNNEHFHICLPGPIDANRIEKYRKRLRTKYGGSGNGFISCKGYANGLSSFVFYCGHEGTKARYEDPIWKDIIEAQLTMKQPYFVKQTRMDKHLESSKMTPEEKKKLRDWEITYTNLVPQCYEHWKSKKMDTESLRAVAQDLFQTTKWKPCRQMRINGVPEHYQMDFEYRIGKRESYDMSWWTPKY